MKRFALGVLLLALVAVAYADHRAVIFGPGQFVPRTYGSRHGFGNVVFPGTGSPPPMGFHPFSVASPGFAHSLGGIVGGFQPFTGAPFGRHFRRQFPAYVPVAYPVFVGGYSPDYPDYPTQPPANVTIINQPAPPPQIIINTGSQQAQPVVREYGPDSWKGSGVEVYQAPSPGASEAARSETEATVYLIAFRDGTIYPALAWWVEDDTLHYITAQGKPNKASLALIDREFSERLNQERGIEFRLPAF